MDKDHGDFSHRQEDESNRPRSSSQDKEGENSKVYATTVDVEDQEDSRPQSGKDPIEKGDSSKKSEIDLSFKSQKTTSEEEGKKTKQQGEREAIAILSPTEAVFEAETKPIDQSPPKETLKSISTKKRKLHPQKTKTDASSKAYSKERSGAKVKRSPKKTRPHTFKSTPKQATATKGVAYLEGNMIRMAGGVRLRPGDEVKVGEKEFTLKGRKRRGKLPYILITIFLVIALLLSYQLLKGKDSGKLIGMVLEEKSRMPLSNAEIQIRELGKKVRSNQLGFFMFDVMPSGSYTLQTSLKGYQSVGDKVTITKKQATTLTVSLSPKQDAGLSGKSPEETSPETKAPSIEKAQDKFGAIKIESNVLEPLVMVDDWKLGAGNKVYKDIYIGKHTVKLSKGGYQDWIQKVQVKPGETLKLKVDLVEAGADIPGSKTSEDLIALAQDQMSSNDFSAAVNSYSHALNLDRNSAEALLGRGLAYVQLNERSKALDDLSEAAKYYARKKDCHKAIICYTNLLGLDDKNLESFYNRGLCYLELGQYQKSIADFEKTIELDEKFFSGYLYLGEAHYRLGDYEPSFKNYKKANKLNPHSQQVYVGLAKAYFAKGEKSSAKKNYKKFKELSTYIDRERMKQDPEWRELLKGIGEKAEPEF